jgi:hypothetical protein
MQPDPELETWRRQWQADRTVPPDLQRRVAREIRGAKRGMWIAIGVTLFFGVGVPLKASLGGRPEDAVLAIGVWIFIVLTWITSLRITRGASKPAAATTAAFLDFSILSCRRHLAEITAAATLYLVLLAFIVWLNYRESSPQASIELRVYLTSWRYLVIWAVTAVLGVFALWRRQMLRRELRNLLEIRRSGPGDDGWRPGR